MLHTFYSSLNANIIRVIREGEGNEIRKGRTKNSYKIVVV